MADTGIFATTAEVQRKVGAGASSTSNAEAYINDFMTQAESLINCETRHNWSDDYSSLDVDVKGILKLAASAKAAMMVIQYDMSGYRSLSEAQTMLNVLEDEYQKAITLLRDQSDVKNFIADESGL